MALSEAQMAVLCSKRWGKNSPRGAVMFAIAFFESGFRPEATGGVGEKGLWQIYPDAWPDLDKKYNLYDPVQNSYAAAVVARKQGLTAWSVYKNRGSNPQWGATVARGKAAMMRVSAAPASQIATISATIPGIPDIPGLPTLPGLPDIPDIPNPFNPNLPDVPNPLAGAAALVDVIKFFTDPGNWMRVATYASGGVLIGLGFFLLATTPVAKALADPVRKAAKVVPQAKALKVVKK